MQNLLLHPAWPTEIGGTTVRPSLYDHRDTFIDNVSPFCAAAIYFGNFGTAPQDAALSRQALLKLSYVNRHFLQPAGLKATVQKNTVHFLGNVTSKAILKLAEFTAKEIEGVTDIDLSDVSIASPILENTLSLRASFSPEDAEAKARGQLLLATDQMLSTVKLVAVQKKLAFLEGEVATAQQKTWAEQLVAGTGLDISSKITLNPSQKPTASALLLDDESLLALIRFRLDMTLETAKVSWKIRATRGIVTLTGKVSSEALRQRAENLVHSTLGVREVRATISLIA